MSQFFIYLLQVNTALSVFYLLYIFVLKRDTFFRLRRFFLFVGDCVFAPLPILCVLFAQRLMAFHFVGKG